MSDILTNSSAPFTDTPEDWQGYCDECNITLHTCGELSCEEDDGFIITPVYGTMSQAILCHPCYEKLYKEKHLFK